VSKIPLPNFSKGEVAPALYGRIDTGQYNAALKTARNFLVQKYGGVTFRPGTRLVGAADGDVRLVPFQFSIDQSYVLAMGQGQMRPVALGGFVLEADLKIEDASQSDPCVLTISNHGYAPGDRLYLAGIEGMVELNGRFVTVVAVPTGNSVAIDVNSGSFTPFAASTGAVHAEAPEPQPVDPVVPPVVLPPPDPYVGGGGGYDYDWHSPYMVQF